MKIKTYTGYLDGEEIREIYRDEKHSIQKIYEKGFAHYQVMKYCEQLEWVGSVKKLEDAMKLISMTAKVVNKGDINILRFNQ